MPNPITRAALTAAIVVGASLPLSQPADAGRGGRIAAGLFAGVVAGSILGG